MVNQSDSSITTQLEYQNRTRQASHGLQDQLGSGLAIAYPKTKNLAQPLDIISLILLTPVTNFQCIDRLHIVNICVTNWTKRRCVHNVNLFSI